jgi:hypothetical protein
MSGIAPSALAAGHALRDFRSTILVCTAPTKTVHLAAATIQPPISPIPCRTLNKLILSVLFSPVLTNPHPRPASAPTALRVLCDLCVKTSPPLNLNRPAISSTPTRTRPTTPAKTAKICTFLHRKQNSGLLFSTACEQFCNCGGGGGVSDFRMSNFEFRSSIFPISFPFIFLQTLSRPAKTQLLYFQMYPNSLQKTPGWGEGRYFHLPHYLATSLLLLCGLLISPLTTRHSSLATSTVTSHQSLGTNHPSLASNHRPCYRPHRKGDLEMSLNKVTIQQGSSSRRSIATRDLSSHRSSFAGGIHVR